MALEPVWAALVDAPSLPLAQQRVLAELLARQGDPVTAARFFTRPDVTAETRAFLIREAYDWQLVKAVLATPVVTTESMLIAAEKLGAEMVLTEVARTRWDLREAQLLLIERLDHASARRVAEAWTYAGPELRMALIDAAVRDKPEMPDKEVGTDPRREAEHDAWVASVEAWREDIWALVSAEPAKSLWPDLIARGADHPSTGLIVNLILNRGEGLSDQTLLACLRSAFPEAASQPDVSDEWEAQIRLLRLAKIVTSHPRALLLHGSVLRLRINALAAVVVAHAREEGIDKWDWSHWESLAAICTSPEVLDAAADVVATVSLPSWWRDGRPDAEWIAGRAKAADALAENPLLPPAALPRIASLLSSTTAARFVQHSDEEVRKAAEDTVTQALAQTHSPRHDTQPSFEEPESRQVPNDEVLAESNDPRAELAAFLPLKGRAAYKRQVAEAIAGSRYADAELLRQLPTALVLRNTAHAPGVASLLQEELGDNAAAWAAFVEKARRLTSNATKTLSAFIEEVRDSGPVA
ncbi:hypothetical protein ACWCV9_37270 [Streptomyces sp. NPDC001606]